MLVKSECEWCGGGLEFDAENLGERIECPHCQEQTVLAKPKSESELSEQARSVAPEPTAPIPESRPFPVGISISGMPILSGPATAKTGKPYTAFGARLTLLVLSAFLVMSGIMEDRLTGVVLACTGLILFGMACIVSAIVFGPKR